MNADYNEVIAATDTDRSALFVGAAARLGAAVQNVEKDFWVCWTLDLLFNGMPPESPRLLFKGGTSLSKAFGLISRFSEDIDIAVFREDIGHAIDTAALDGLSGKQRRLRLDAIGDACQTYLNGPFAERIAAHLATTGDKRLRLERDKDDRDQQTFLLWYPANARNNAYIRSAVKIEAGAKSALDPHTAASVMPYVAEDLPHLNLRVDNITTVEAERTVWDKIIILHGLRQWYAHRGVLRHGGQRVSRHYYDVHQILNNPRAAAWLQNHALAQECAAHARLFFGSPDLGLEQAAPGTFTLMPTPPMRDALRMDYAAMAGMIFGTVPSLDDVLVTVEQLEATINGQA